MSRRALGLVLGLLCLGQSAGAAVESAASDPLQALPALQQALSAPDLTPLQALPLWRQQIAHLLALQNLSAADQALARALPLAAGLPREQAELQLLLGELRLNQGQLQQAASAYQQARTLFAQDPPEAGNGQSRALLALAQLSIRQGLPEQAHAALAQGMGALAHANDQRLMHAFLMAMADTYSLNGSFTSAQTYAQMAQALGQTHAEPALQAEAQQLLGDMYWRWGHADKALAAYQQALILAPPGSSQQRQILLAQAEIQARQRQLTQARKTLAQVQQQPAPAAGSLKHFQTQLQLARVWLALGSFAEARTAVQGLLQQPAWLQQPLPAAEAFLLLGEIERQNAQPAAAARAYQQGLQALQALPRTPLRGPLAAGLGLSQLAQQQPQAAITSLEQALESFIHYDEVDPQILAEAFEQLAPTFQALVQAYLQAGQPERAFERYEDGRALALLQQLDSFQRGNLLAAMPQATSRYLQALLPADTTVLAYAESPGGGLIRFQVRQDDLRAAPLDVAGLLQAHPHWPVLSARFQHAPADWAAWVQQYRQLLSNPASDLGELKALGEMLAALLLPSDLPLSPAQRLLILPDAALSLLPFEALRPDAAHYLIEKVGVQYVQSLSVLKSLQARQYSDERLPVLALGDPLYETLSYSREPVESRQQMQQLRQLVWGQPDGHMREIYGALYQPQWAPLPGTRQELESIQQELPAAQLRTQLQVDEAELKALSEAGELQRYKVLHFATHGLTVAELPELSALVLSQQQEAQSEDGYLRVPEVARLKLAADFVNLSACETGLGKVFRGEGVAGLSQAFLKAGAQQVAVSLWQINDQSTARLMQALYSQAGAHASHALALNAVKRQFIQGDVSAAYQHPYYWSPFVVYGLL